MKYNKEDFKITWDFKKPVKIKIIKEFCEDYPVYLAEKPSNKKELIQKIKNYVDDPQKSDLFYVADGDEGETIIYLIVSDNDFYFVESIDYLISAVHTSSAIYEVTIGDDLL